MIKEGCHWMTAKQKVVNELDGLENSRGSMWPRISVTNFFAPGWLGKFL